MITSTAELVQMNRNVGIKLGVDCFYCVPKNTVEKNTVEKTQWELIHKIIKGLLAQGVLLPCLNELVRVCMMGIW